MSITSTTGTDANAACAAKHGMRSTTGARIAKNAVAAVRVVLIHTTGPGANVAPAA